MIYKPVKTIEDFWARVNITNDIKDCWELKNCKGYGRIFYMGKTWRGNRLSYLLNFGFIDEKLMVMHMCDNPPCVNPNHLIQGAAKDNTQDMIKKERYYMSIPNRYKRGEFNVPLSLPPIIPQEVIISKELSVKLQLESKEIIDISKCWALNCFDVPSLARLYHISKKQVKSIISALPPNLWEDPIYTKK